jgi:hypothetical protein
MNRSIRQHRHEEHIMSATHKSSGAAAAIGAQIDNFFADCAKKVTTGFEELTELRRQSLDVVAQQNGQLVSVWNKGIELAVEAFQQSVQAQKDILEVAAERNRVMTRLATEQTESFTKVAVGVTAAVDTLANYARSAQKQVVDFAATQNTAAYAAAMQQFESSGQAAAETFKRGVDTLIETQRSVLGARDAA